MPLPTDFVMRGCVVNIKECILTNKCKVCRKEIEDLNKIDEMFLNKLQENERELPGQS